MPFEVDAAAVPVLDPRIFRGRLRGYRISTLVTLYWHNTLKRIDSKLSCAAILKLVGASQKSSLSTGASNPAIRSPESRIVIR